MAGWLKVQAAFLEDRVQSQGPIWQLTTISNSSSRGHDGPQGQQAHMWYTDRYKGKTPIPPQIPEISTFYGLFGITVYCIYYFKLDVSRTLVVTWVHLNLIKIKSPTPQSHLQYY